MRPTYQRLEISPLIVILIVQMLFLGAAITNTATAPIASFSFTSSGDFGANKETTAVLAGIPGSGASFTLALGDLSYNQVTPESAWCNFVTQRVGATYPFQLISGNHESNGENGLIDNFVKCLPNRIGAISGTYGKEYYFDYPATNSFARFILVSPSLTFSLGGTYSYASGSSHYNWVANAIDTARARGIPWIIVGMHENCITTGANTCEIGTDIFNLLLSKRVDLILQGHDHNNQRSKQLTCAKIGTYDSSCVRNDGSTGNYTKGAGSILVIDGTSGAGNVGVDSSNPEYPYFATTDSSTMGFYQYTVTSTTLNARFVPRQGSYTDAFSIGENPPRPTPLATGFTYSPASPSPGTTISFQATASGGTPRYSFNWNFGDGSTASGQSVAHAYSFQGSYTVTETATDSGGQSSTSSQTVTVSSQPPAQLSTSFTYSPSSPTVGTAVSFQASANGGTPPYRFSWNFGDGSSTVGDAPTHTYTSPGDYKVIENALDSTGQFATASGTITVSTPPPPPPSQLSTSFSYSPSNPQTMTSITFTASAQGGTQPYTFAWDFGDGSTGAGQSVSHAYSNPGSYAVRLNTGDAGGETSTAAQTVTVSSPPPPPPLTASFSYSPDSPTATSTVSLQGSASGGVTPYTFSWSFGDSASGNGASPTHVYQTAGTYTITLKVTDASGQVATSSKSIVINSAPIPLSASFTYSPSNPVALTSISFTATATGGAQPYSYDWDFGDGTTSSGKSITHSYLLPGTYTVTLTVRDATGASATASKTITVSLL